MPASTSTEDLVLDLSQAPFAIITFNMPSKKNAMNGQQYKRLSQLLQSIDRMDAVKITLLTGRGDFWSAGADVKAVREGFGTVDEEARTAALRRLSETNLDLTRALYRHSKLLIAGLNGPAIGLSAAMLGNMDFVYAVENAYILTPFTALSLVAEGGASLTFPRRMGIVKANEALLFGKKLTAPELHANGFFNKLFPASSDATFRQSLMAYLREKIEGLDLEAALITKQLIKQTLPDPDPSNLREIFAGADRFATGKPAEQFAKVASKQMRHKI